MVESLDRPERARGEQTEVEAGNRHREREGPLQGAHDEV